MNSTALLSLQSVSFKYAHSDTWVLKEISFDLNVGQSLAIVGVSGRGKTTLLRILCGLVRPTLGEVVFKGSKLSAPTRSIGVVFQNYHPTVFDWLSVSQNIVLGLDGSRGAADRDQDIKEIAKDLNIEEYLSRPARTLSGGQRQRVAIGRVLIQGADLIILDEPFSNLDPISRHDLVDLLLKMKVKWGITVVVVSHDIREALRVADTGYCLLKPESDSQLQLIASRGLGEIQKDYTPEERFGNVFSTLLLDRVGD